MRASPSVFEVGGFTLLASLKHVTEHGREKEFDNKTPTNISARAIAATESSAFPALKSAADVAFLDPLNAVTTKNAFSTRGGCIAASAWTVDCALGT